jgi:preprotein translocase subunit SecA
MQAMLSKIFGSQNERDLKRLEPLVAQINALEDSIKKLSDSELQNKTVEFRERLNKGETFEDIFAEAFAVVRESAWRVLKMRHFDVQLLGGIVLHQGMIAEMKTGEGKTLVATLPVYLNALTGKGVHVVTVNDYLAKRDSEWMGQVYNFLGLSVGVIVHGLSDEQRKLAYEADVTYGTNNEFGFDFLRDNMKYQESDFVQRKFHFAIIDEVDSILIDEARTPLIISGPSEQSTDKYKRIDKIVPRLKRGEVIEDKDGNKTSTQDFTVDEKSKSVVLTDQGVGKVEQFLGVENLYDPQHIDVIHHVHQALKAHALFKRDVDYVVKEGKVLIVDEFTGRLMPGRRWSDGLHQAVEAKEGVRIENENQTLATITFQNLFRMYEKLAGMTGTADTEAAEFGKIYNLQVRIIPTNRPMARQDHADVIYKTEREKFHEVIEDIKDCHERGQPVLVGTISIEKSEELAGLLKKHGIPHNILNAKKHDREASIIAQAGHSGAVTISTNMAGRGTDIVLGGNPEFLTREMCDPDEDPQTYRKKFKEFQDTCRIDREKVVAAGGLYVLGTERHESRRIDNQLRGRSGRQGDPGVSRFYLSLQDNLLRIFGSERISKIMDRLGIEEYEPITHPWISKAIENAQKKVEGHNFEIRKNLLEYDDVMNQQRKTVYGLRRRILEGNEVRDVFDDAVDHTVTDLVDTLLPDKFDKDFDCASLDERCLSLFGWRPDYSEFGEDDWNSETIGTSLYKRGVMAYDERAQEHGEEIMGHVAKVLMLSTLDSLWKDNLLMMDHLREGIGLRGYGQKDPLLEYKREGLGIFQEMLGRFYADLVQKINHVKISSEMEQSMMEQGDAVPMQLGRGDIPGATPERAQAHAPVAPGTVTHQTKKLGRNEPCHCGSGKKFKKCHGK